MPALHVKPRTEHPPVQNPFTQNKLQSLVYAHELNKMGFVKKSHFILQKVPIPACIPIVFSSCYQLPFLELHFPL